MKCYSIIFVMASLLQSSIVVEAAEPLSLPLSEALAAELTAVEALQLDQSIDLLLAQSGASDSDRGCCVLGQGNTKCAYASRAYCKQLAANNNLAFEFHQNSSCRKITACPAK